MSDKLLPRRAAEAKMDYPSFYTDGFAAGRSRRDTVGMELSRLIVDDHQRAAYSIGLEQGLKPDSNIPPLDRDF